MLAATKAAGGVVVNDHVRETSDAELEGAAGVCSDVVFVFLICHAVAEGLDVEPSSFGRCFEIADGEEWNFFGHGNAFDANAFVEVVSFDAGHNVVCVFPIFMLVGRAKCCLGTTFGIGYNIFKNGNNPVLIAQFARFYVLLEVCGVCSSLDLRTK